MSTDSSASQPRSETGIYTWTRYIHAWQRLYWLTGHLIGRWLMRGQHITFAPNDLEPGMHYVLAANHQTYLDPWVVPGLIPYAVWGKIGMPRAFVANRFFGYPVVGFILRSVGSFPAREHPTDPYGLPYAISLLARGQSIVIFPEGRITLHRQNPAHRGVMVLAREPNVRIIPVHLEWRRAGLQSNFDIGIGQPFDASAMTADEILARVYALPVTR